MFDKSYNPWVVASLDEFNFLCCPECIFRTKEEITFQVHAMQNHPLSNTFFKSEESQIEDTKVATFKEENNSLSAFEVKNENDGMVTGFQDFSSMTAF